VINGFTRFIYGAGKHQWNAAIGDLYIALRVIQRLEYRGHASNQLQYVYAVQIMYCLALYSAKISILIQIKHIFEGTQQRKSFIFWASWALIVAVSCTYLSTLTVLIFSCTPIRKVCTVTRYVDSCTDDQCRLGIRSSPGDVIIHPQAASPAPSTLSVTLQSFCCL
jgi:hypothetical protein